MQHSIQCVPNSLNNSVSYNCEGITTRCQITEFLLLSGPGEEPHFCCDSRQINDLIVNFGQALNLVGRCPSCARNLRMIFCTMTCDPHHSRFLSYNTTEEHSTPEPVTNSTVVVKALEYYISDTYVTEMYDSCKEVTNPSSNSLVMPTICGQWGEDCSPHRYEKSIL